MHYLEKLGMKDLKGAIYGLVTKFPINGLILIVIFAFILPF